MLTKDFQRTYIPASPGSPEVPYRASYTVCQQAPAPGYWQRTCTIWNPPVPTSGGGVQVPPGARLVYIGDEWHYEICTSKWVTTGPPGPKVCTTYPEQPYVPAVPGTPARVETTAIHAWDAGANSADAQSGNCECTFTMTLVSGVYVGLTDAPEAVPDFNRLTHALAFHGRKFQVVEAGAARTSDTTFADGDEFKIRRVGVVVTYFHNDEIVYTSKAPSTGEVRVGSALYATGDYIE